MVAVVNGLTGLALTVALAAPAWAVQDCELNGQHVNPANGSTTQGKTGLMRCKDRDSGVLQREQELQGGKFVGLVRFYQEGKLQREHSVNERGNIHGQAREFAPDGKVLREATYDNAAEVGISRSFHRSGQLRRISFSSSPVGEKAYAEFTERGQLTAVRCGEQAVLAPVFDDARACGFLAAASPVELFSGNGQLRSRSSYVQGKRVRFEALHDNGKVAQQEEVTGGRRIDRRFSAEGVKRRETMWTMGDRSAVKEREQEFSEAGTLVRDQRWISGEPASEESYYLNGQPKSKVAFRKEGSRDVMDVSEYFDSGVLAGEGRFLRAGPYRRTPLGMHKRFNDAGRLVGESTYDDKGRLTRERAWDESGRLARDDEVFEDGSRKALSR